MEGKKVLYYKGEKGLQLTIYKKTQNRKKNMLYLNTEKKNKVILDYSSNDRLQTDHIS